MEPVACRVLSGVAQVVAWDHLLGGNTCSDRRSRVASALTKPPLAVSAYDRWMVGDPWVRSAFCRAPGCCFRSNSSGRRC